LDDLAADTSKKGEHYLGFVDPDRANSSVSRLLDWKLARLEIPGSKNQTNLLKRRGRRPWFFIHFRGPKALFDSYPIKNPCLSGAGVR
jgi:hypothetical protein